MMFMGYGHRAFIVLSQVVEPQIELEFTSELKRVGTMLSLRILPVIMRDVIIYIKGAML